MLSLPHMTKIDFYPVINDKIRQDKVTSLLLCIFLFSLFSLYFKVVSVICFSKQE